MGKEIQGLAMLKLKKSKFHHYKDPIYLKPLDIYNII